MTHDYSGVMPVPNESKISELVKLAVELEDAKAKVVRLEIDLAVAKSEARELEEEIIPGLMDEIPLKEFVLPSGLRISVEKQVFASITKANQADAFDWLVAHGHGGMIKEELVRRVHPSTLKAWARRRLEAGENVPDDLFGLHVKRIANTKKK